MKNKTDWELMRLVMDNHRPALEEIYDRYARLIYSFALKSAKQEDAARDILQLVFTRLWSTQKGYDPAKGQFVNWLLTITRNIAIDQLRKEKNHTRLVNMETEQWELIADSSNNRPEEAASQTLLREQIRSAYQFLSENQVRLIEHFYWEGYTLSELAEKYGEPLGTIKSRLHQTLKILRKHLQAER
jgi:RNA polymerase sigma factor (sigma-70 family)